MSAETAIALLVFLFPLAYSPGPGNAFFAAIGASSGLRAATRPLVGYHVATFAVTLLIGIGMGVTLLANPVIAKSIAAAGSLYVLWLAWTFVRPARRAASNEGTPSEPVTHVGFWSGAIVLLLNPKAYYIIAVMFAQFIRPPLDDQVFTVVLITVIFTLNNLVAFLAWTLAGSALTALFRGERAKKWINYFFAAALVGVAVWMAVPIFI